MNLKIFTLLLSSLSLIACGSGSVGSLSYDGITTPANLTEDNAKETIIEGLASVGVSGASSSNADDVRDNVISRSKLMARKMMQKVQSRSENAIDDIDQSNLFESSIEEGSCGGSVTTRFPASFDYSDGDDFSIEVEMVFDNYCEQYDDIKNIMSGKMLMTMVVTEGKSEATKVTMHIEFVDILSKEGDQEYLMAGTLSTSIDGTSILNGKFKTTLNFVMQDLGSNTTYQFEDFIMNASYAFDFSSGFEIKISYAGRVYNSKYGYLDITTNKVLLFVHPEDFPISGELEFKGANNASAKLLFNTDSRYEFQLDTNGDGIVDKTETGATIDLNDGELFGVIAGLNVIF